MSIDLAVVPKGVDFHDAKKSSRSDEVPEKGRCGVPGLDQQLPHNRASSMSLVLQPTIAQMGSHRKRLTLAATDAPSIGDHINMPNNLSAWPGRRSSRKLYAHHSRPRHLY
jgi:hypothetical protein